MSDRTSHYNLDQLRGLMDGDEEALLHMVRVFAASSPDILAEMNLSFEAADWEALSNAAHKMKSSIDLFDISELRPSIREIESLAKARSGSAAIRPLLDRLNVVMKAVFDDLQSLIS